MYRDHFYLLIRAFPTTSPDTLILLFNFSLSSSINLEEHLVSKHLIFRNDKGFLEEIEQRNLSLINLLLLVRSLEQFQCKVILGLFLVVAIELLTKLEIAPHKIELIHFATGHIAVFLRNSLVIFLHFENCGSVPQILKQVYGAVDENLFEVLFVFVSLVLRL